MPILGVQSIILPSSADVARAFSDVVFLPKPAPTASGIYTATGTYFEVVVSIFALLRTSAVAGQRGVLVQYNTADGAGVAEVHPASSVGPNTVSGMQWMLGYGNATIEAGATNQNGPLPAIVLQPGWQIVIVLNPAIAGDGLEQIALYVQRFPTSGESRVVSAAEPAKV